MRVATSWSIPWDVVAAQIPSHLGGRWFTPVEFGPDGFSISENGGPIRTVIVSVADWDGDEWVHASVTRASSLPTYHDLAALRSAVWPNGFAFQVFAPPSAHVNIHSRALHLWGLASGNNPLPDFGAEGTI